MKKIILIAVFLGAALLVSAQEKKSDAAVKYADGYYYAASEKAMTQGWVPFVEFNVKNGNVTDLKFNKIKKGELASNDKFYNSLMKKKAGTNPAEYSVNIPAMFMQKGSVEKMDAVTGATQSVEEFSALMKFLLEKAGAGKPGKYAVENRLLEHKK